MGKQFDVVFPLFFVRFLWFLPRWKRFTNFKKICTRGLGHSPIYGNL